MFGLSSKALMISGGIIAALLLALGIAGKLLANSYLKLGYAESERAAVVSINKKNFETIRRLRAERQADEREAKRMQRRLNSLTNRLDTQTRRTRELEAENEEYRAWRNDRAHPVANERVYEAINSARDRILGTDSTEDVHTD